MRGLSFLAHLITMLPSPNVALAEPETTALEPGPVFVNLPWYRFLLAMKDNVFFSFAQAQIAAGTGASSGTPITADWTEFTTVPSGTGGTISQQIVGAQVLVWNLGANPLLVYAPGGVQIDRLGAGTPYSLPAGKCQVFSMVASGQTYSLQLG